MRGATGVGGVCLFSQMQRQPGQEKPASCTYAHGMPRQEKQRDTISLFVDIDDFFPHGNCLLYHEKMKAPEVFLNSVLHG
jgi:hypothetical protein